MKVTEWKKVRADEVEDGRLLRITLAAGKGNVLDREAIWELRETLVVFADSARLRGIVLDHDGPHFSFGASVAEHTRDQVRDMLPKLHALARDLVATNLPILVAVRGMCLGGGLELALLGQRLFAAPDARFGQPEVQLGVFAPLGSLLLPEAVGARNAADLLLSGRTVDAAAAQAMGLVQELADDPAEAALGWAREHLLPKSAVALRFAVRAMTQRSRAGLLEGLAELERVYLDELTLEHDPEEGIRAFLEKRPPVWEDR